MRRCRKGRISENGPTIENMGRDWLYMGRNTSSHKRRLLRNEDRSKHIPICCTIVIQSWPTWKPRPSQSESWRPGWFLESFWFFIHVGRLGMLGLMLLKQQQQQQTDALTINRQREAGKWPCFLLRAVHIWVNFRKASSQTCLKVCLLILGSILLTVKVNHYNYKTAVQCKKREGWFYYNSGLANECQLGVDRTAKEL